jgi:hypothetical protein
MAEPEIGEARSKAGRPPLPEGLRRSHTLRVSFAAHDAEDIREIAAAWGVAPGLAIWAIVMDQLARWRKVEPRYGKHGLAIAGALQVLRQEWAEERAAANGGCSDAE